MVLHGVSWMMIHRFEALSPTSAVTTEKPMTLDHRRYGVLQHRESDLSVTESEQPNQSAPTTPPRTSVGARPDDCRGPFDCPGAGR